MTLGPLVSPGVGSKTNVTGGKSTKVDGTKKASEPKPTDERKQKSFADNTKLEGHFDKHGAEFNASSSEEYLAIARDVIQKGTKVK
ncbi:hypothetical protein [Terasakiella pusilla]|uniref:hypothetical protein n=1 Tax=Terasakiella pusilla TaxID=64973 RepID=UPI003AA9196A